VQKHSQAPATFLLTSQNQLFVSKPHLLKFRLGLSLPATSGHTMDASFWSAQLQQALHLCKEWEQEQTRTKLVLDALVEFHGRATLLDAAASDGGDVLGVLQDFEDVPTLLLAKHARGMERLLSALHASVAQFESVQQRLGSLHASVWARYAESSQQTAAESSARPTWTVVGAGQGQAAQHVLIPSTMQLLGWLGELDAMLCDDILVKHQLMEVLSFDVDPERLSQLVRVWSQAAHVRQEPLQRLQALAASLTLDS